MAFASIGQRRGARRVADLSGGLNAQSAFRLQERVPGAEAFGVVAAGNRADLVLTHGNPLEDLATLRKPLGVMSAGRWYPRARLEAMLAAVGRDYER